MNWNQTEVKHSSFSRATHMNEISLGIIIWGSTLQAELLWHACLKVYHSLKELTPKHYCALGIKKKKNLLAVNIYCEDLILLLSYLLSGVLTYHVLDNPSRNIYRKPSLASCWIFPRGSPSCWILFDLQVDLCYAALVLLEGVKGECVFCPVPCSEICSKWKYAWILRSCHTLICMGVNGYRRSRVVGN